jgi:2-polyprenyl-6-methoxyphenol hydroxylase-like FAD-dependent oxidoreductase
MRPEVLIVGAGPTGLVLALWLTRLGVSVRIIDKSAGPGETSRAIAVQARTLELYRQAGLADDVVAGGLRVERITVRARGRAIAQARLGDMGTGLSPFPFVLSFPQDEHERVLVAHLERAGGRVERQTQLLALAETPTGVRATLESSRGTEVVETAYVCGCDGASSTTRQLLGIQFPGGTYAQVFFVADAIVSGAAADGGLQMCLGARDFCLVIPVRSTGSFRLIGLVPPSHERQETICFEDVAPAVARTTGLTVHTVNWFSAYHLHHRVADGFRKGRAFLVGDAGHIHSPAGGQGMNTGIGDAVNLAWKLAAVLQGRGSAALLDAYESERIPFARTLVASTDRLFQLVASRSPFAMVWRLGVLAHVIPLVLRLRFVRRQMFRLASQIRIEYRASPLSAGSAGRVHGGDRLPWVSALDNFAPLASLDWQVHVYGRADAALREATRLRGIAMHDFRWSEGAESAGLAHDGLYLVRPDGHVGLADAKQDVARLDAYLSQFAIVPRGLQRT